MCVHVQPADRATQAGSESLQDSWIPAATTEPVSVDDILQIPEVLFTGKDLLRTTDSSSAESNTSGLLLCSTTLNFLLTGWGTLISKKKMDKKNPMQVSFAFINNVRFM